MQDSSPTTKTIIFPKPVKTLVPDKTTGDGTKFLFKSFLPYY